MKIEKRTAVLLCIILAACSLCSAQASSFREAVSFFTGSRDIHFELETEIKKLPQFSEERTGQLNRLLKHITVKGTTGEHQSEASFLLDGRLLFSMIRTDSEEKPVSMIAPDPLYYYILPEDSETGKESVSELSNDLDALLRNISFLETLDALNIFISRLPMVFPDKTSTAKTQPQTFRDYGKVVKKSTVTLDGEELTEYVRENKEMFPYFADRPEKADLVFEGRQTFSLYFSGEDTLVMAVFSGCAGENGEDLRTVRLDWKTVRGETMEKDELQLRTPNRKGTRRNNLLLTYEWKKAEDGSETIRWTAETDRVADGIRTRIFDEASLSFAESRVSGSMYEKRITGNVTAAAEGILNTTVTADGHYDGTLEINHKNDKIEKDRMIVRFKLTPGSSAQVSAEQPEILETDREQYNELLGSLYAKIIQEMLKLPEEDIALFKEDIPDEAWETIFPGQD